MSANKAVITPQTLKTKPSMAESALKKTPLDRRYYFAFTVGAAAVLIVLLLSILVIRPLVNKSLSTAKDLHYRTEEASDLTTKLSNLKTLKQNFLALGSDTESKILVAMPTDPDEPHLTSLLATVAGQSGVRLLSISYETAEPVAAPAPAPAGTSTSGAMPTAATPSVSAQAISVDLSVTGPYASISSFLGNLENAPRIMDVTSVNISGQSPGLTASITASAYYSPVATK